MSASLFRAAPCPICHSDEPDRALVLDAANIHGWICLSHRPALIPQPKAEA